MIRQFEFKWVKRILSILFVGTISWIMLIALSSSVTQYTVAFPVILAFVLFCVSILNKKARTILEKIPDRLLHLCAIILLGAAFLVMQKIAFSLRVDVFDTWDYGQLIRTAYGINMHGQIDATVYYAQYPNNSMFLWILTMFFRCVKPIAGDNIYNYINASIPLDCAIISLAVLFTYLSVCRLRGAKNGIRALIIMLGMLPLYAYATMAYTDVFGILPVALALFFYAGLKTKRGAKKKYLCLCMLAVTTAIGYRIKATLIIVFIAILIDLLLSDYGWRQKAVYAAVFVLLNAVCLKGTTVVTHQFLLEHGVSDKEIEENEFPVSHWLMMSLNPKADGGYVADDVAYTRGFVGKEAKRAANIEKIKERIQEMGPGGTLEHLFVKKVVRMWGSGSCNSEVYTSRQPLSDTFLRSFFARNGRYNFWYCIITQMYYVMLLALLLGFAIHTVSGTPLDDMLTIKLIIMGVFAFFILWECNSRYLVVFFPVIVIGANEALGMKMPRRFPDKN